MFSGLESLLLAGNPQRQLPSSLLQRGTAATLDYLRDRLPPGHRPRTPVMPPPPPPAFVKPGGADSGGVPHGVGFSGGATGAVQPPPPSSGVVGGGQEAGEAMKKIAALKAEVAVLAAQMEAPGMSQAKAYATKKSLQMKRAAVIREERALKKLQQQGGP